MYSPKLEKDIRCPLEYGLAVFGGKWKSRIICVLAEKKTLRYGQLRREMTDIADPVLASALRELMEYGIVKRCQYEEIPPRVGVFADGRGTVCHTYITEHLPLVGSLPEGRERKRA